MSASKSWFAASASPKNRLLTPSTYELPRWRTPSPMAASSIPPPIVQSTYVAPPDPAVESTIIEKPSAFEERQHELEADLQFLLDAQAEGLIRGLEGGSLDDRSSTGSTTPTVQSVRSRSARRQRKPARKQPGLRSARKGIYNSIVALSSLKDDELQDVQDQLDINDSRLEQIMEWEDRRQGLKEAVGNVDSSEEIVRMQRLKQEADTLQAEINQVELQLTDMKTRQRSLMRQATAVENSIQAKMASYSASMRLLEEDIQKFLSFSPRDKASHASSPEGKLSVWQLPPKRRNLEMAKEYWTEQQELVKGQHRQHEYEKEALVAGAGLWRDAVTEITDFEKRLRSEMSLRPSSPNSQSAWEDPQSTSDHGERMHDLLHSMDKLIASLEIKYQKADEKNWRLLIAALAAELDALRRGKEILAGAVGIAGETLVNADGHDQKRTDSGDEIHALDSDFQTTGPAAGVSDSGDDHEEPDAELLFSRTDTE